ncbi:MAG: nucleotidyltransferase domain-containing protein [Caenispirillum bisanense]|nr:nucleotidyltransferase domain-containing protein [Caenispirillum bisanense]
MSAPAPIPDPDPILTRLVARIVDVFEPEAVWLFGSRARGDAAPDSDYDFLVVVPDDAPAEQASWRRAALVVRDASAGADIVPVRRGDFERRRAMVGTLSYKATHEGRAVYG